MRPTWWILGRVCGALPLRCIACRGQEPQSLRRAREDQHARALNTQSRRRREHSSNGAVQRLVAPLARSSGDSRLTSAHGILTVRSSLAAQAALHSGSGTIARFRPLDWRRTSLCAPPPSLRRPACVFSAQRPPDLSSHDGDEQRGHRCASPAGSGIVGERCRAPEHRGRSRCHRRARGGWRGTTQSDCAAFGEEQLCRGFPTVRSLCCVLRRGHAARCCRAACPPLTWPRTPSPRQPPTCAPTLCAPSTRASSAPSPARTSGPASSCECMAGSSCRPVMLARSRERTSDAARRLPSAPTGGTTRPPGAAPCLRRAPPSPSPPTPWCLSRGAP